MSNKVDKIFKDKLEEHSLPPSGKAWEKVEANLSKKNKTIVWFRLAAAIALLGVFTFFILQWRDKGDTHPTLVIENNKSKTPEVAQPEIVKPEATTSEQLQATKSTPKTTHSKKEKQKKEEKVSAPVAIDKPLLIAEEKNETVEQEIVAEAEKAVSEKSITLVFTLPTIKSKTVTEEVAAAEEKKTALQKVVETANDIRSGDVLGSLRDAKNELFALEFRKDKSKKQE